MAEKKIRTLGQQRAEFALERVSHLKSNRKDFKSFSSSAPAMILKNGFGQSLAFFMAKGTDKDLNIKPNDKHIELFDIIKSWLIKQKIVDEQNHKDFVKSLAQMSQKKYLEAQLETLALLEWVKRYANAFIEE